MLQLSARMPGIPWGGQRVCHRRASHIAPLTAALLLSLAGKDGETSRELQPAGMEQGMGSRMRSNRVSGSKDTEPLRNLVVLQLEPLHLRPLH